jgi:hypothetical protein
MSEVKKIGRPTLYNDDLAKEICLKTAVSSSGLKKLCRENPHWPTSETILQWRWNNESFSYQYTQAKQRQIESMMEDIIDISDDSSQDSITRVGKNGEEYEVCNSEFINRSRIRIDTRKWLASKLAPKIYGDKLNIATEKTDEKDIEKARAIAKKCLTK